MKRLYIILSLLLIFSLALPCVSLGEKADKTLTLMIYMCGSNLESEYGAASADLMEIALAGHNADAVNVLIMTGGSSQWTLGMPVDALSVYMPFRNTLRMITAFEGASMGEPAALSTLLNYGYENYPAEKYALILWDHGAGSLGGVCRDELYENDWLTAGELVQALNSSPAAERPLEWIGFDACMMASAEIAMLMSPYARYMIASEETEATTGWNYSFLKDIESDADGAATGERIVNGYFETGEAGARTLSCVDLSAMGTVRTALDDFYSRIGVSGSNYALFAYDVRRTSGYGKAADPSLNQDLVDLYSLVEAHAQQSADSAQALLSALDEAIVISRSDAEGSRGLSVYHPFYNKSDYRQRWGDIYSTLDFSAGYTAYTEQFAQYLFGAAELSWAGLGAARTDDPSIYALPLSPAQRQALQDVQLSILRYDADSGAYTRICTTNEITLQDDIVYGHLSETVLTADGADGAIPYTILPDGTIAVYANYVMDSAVGSGEALSVPSAAKRISPFDTYATAQPESGAVSVTTSEYTETQLGETYDVTVPQTAGAANMVATPASVSELFESRGATPVSGGGLQTQLESAYTQEGTQNAITPVTVTTQGAGINTNRYSVTSPQSLGLGIASLTEVGTDGFTSDQQIISIPEESEEAGLSEVLHACLICAVDADGSVRIIETQIYDAEGGTWTGRGAARTDGYDVIVFPLICCVPTETDGCLNDFAQWTPSGADAIVVPAAEELSLSFAPMNEQTDGLCILFTVTDVQNNICAARPILIQ